MTESTEQDKHEAALGQMRAEMAQAGKQEILEIFSELLDRLWERINSLIGETACVAVFRSALLETSRDHALLQDIEIHSSGISLDGLNTTLDGLDRSAVRTGLLAFTDNVMALLIDLTGEILLGKVEPLVQQFKQKLDKS